MGYRPLMAKTRSREEEVDEANCQQIEFENQLEDYGGTGKSRGSLKMQRNEAADWEHRCRQEDLQEVQ